MTPSAMLSLLFWVPLLGAGVRIATPLLFAGLGELVAERAGLLNVGIEGMMALGAFAGFAVAVGTGDPWLGLLGGALAGLLAGLLFGWLTVLRGADQIVTGVAMNILALGTASLAYQMRFGSSRDVPELPALAVLRLPWLSTLPVIGRPFFGQTPIVYLGYLLIPLVWLLVERTRWGLQVRAAGGNPEALDSAGVSVWRVRLQAIAFGGALAGLGGATLSVAQVGAYVDGMIGGRGFIALAVTVFGGWRAGRVAAACLLFGIADALQLRLQLVGTAVPAGLLVGLPYLLTVAVVTIGAGRGGYPAAINRPYLRRRARRPARAHPAHAPAGALQATHKEIKP
jgi:simple sugar transport system permease protein